MRPRHPAPGEMIPCRAMEAKLRCPGCGPADLDLPPSNPHAPTGSQRLERRFLAGESRGHIGDAIAVQVRPLVAGQDPLHEPVAVTIQEPRHAVEFDQGRDRSPRITPPSARAPRYASDLARVDSRAWESPRAGPAPPKSSGTSLRHSLCPSRPALPYNGSGLAALGRAPPSTALRPRDERNAHGHAILPPRPASPHDPPHVLRRRSRHGRAHPDARGRRARIGRARGAQPAQGLRRPATATTRTRWGPRRFAITAMSESLSLGNRYPDWYGEALRQDLAGAARHPHEPDPGGLRRHRDAQPLARAPLPRRGRTSSTRTPPTTSSPGTRSSSGPRCATSPWTATTASTSRASRRASTRTRPRSASPTPTIRPRPSSAMPRSRASSTRSPRSSNGHLRRGLPRVRPRPGLRLDDGARAAEQERRRDPHLLEGLRARRRADRLSGRPQQPDQRDRVQSDLGRGTAAGARRFAAPRSPTTSTSPARSRSTTRRRRFASPNSTRWVSPTSRRRRTSSWSMSARARRM